MKPKADTNPVSAKDVAKFDVYLRKWQALLNLGDWRITRSTVPAKSNMAEVFKRDLEQRSATIRVGTSFGVSTQVTDQTLEETALHELLHVFLFPLIEFAKCPDTSPEDLSSMEHSVINILEKLLVDRK